MISVNPSELHELVQRVRDWPVHARIQLVQDILGTVSQESTALPIPAGKRMTADEVVAAIGFTGTAPTDQECDRIVEEERMRKYGG